MASAHILELPGEDLDGMHGVNVTIHYLGICTDKPYIGWNDEMLGVVKDMLGILYVK